MAEFVQINTQEEFDAAVKDRIERERKKYGDYEDIKKQLGEAQGTVAENAKIIAELNGRIKGFESAALKSKVAHETGLPYEMAGRLSGETEEDIRKDAEALSKIIGQSTPPTLPLKSTAPEAADVKDAALRKTLSELRGD